MELIGYLGRSHRWKELTFHAARDSLVLYQELYGMGLFLAFISGSFSTLPSSQISYG